MEIKHIKELMASMGRTGTKRLAIKKEGFELEIERSETGLPRVELLSESSSDDNHERADAALGRASLAVSKGKDVQVTSHDAIQEEIAGVFVTSPMVGTFYSSPTPEDPAFVKSGDKIEKNSVVCIIEAMKVMNEIKAGVSGTVVEVLVENGQPVEFGTKLFRIV